MKFLSKKSDSKILKKGIVYKMGGDNTKLRKFLIEEQYNYCAYTEKYLHPLEQVDVEHFDSSKKGTTEDDYYNYYAVITTANKYKKDVKYRGASFFQNKFYQNAPELNRRIGFGNNIFYELDDNDTEARDFIDFLGLNHPKLSSERSNHVQRMKDHFSAATFTQGQIINYFEKYKSELSFISALNVEFGFDFSTYLTNN
jgi:hypothetical protein